MTAASHLISPKIPGYRPSDGRFLPCCGISGAGVFNISPCSSRRDYKSLPKFNILPLRCVSRGGALSVCYAYSGGKERNSDFSRDKQPYLRNRKNRQNEESDDIDNDEDDILPSKNGPLLSGSAKRSTTETPGAKEREIVELFKKVQEKLRQRAALKDEKKVEESQVESKQTETVDSLVNLLRQHSTQQGKQSKSNGTSSDINLDQRKENGPVLKGKTKMSDGPILKGRTKTPGGPNERLKKFTKELLDQPEQDRPIPDDDNVWTFLGSKEVVKPAAQKTEGVSAKRPVSNFQRRSPVPQVRYDPPIDSRVEKNDSFALFTNTNGRKKKKKTTVFEPKPKAKPEPEPEPEPELETELFLDDEGSVGRLLDEEDSEKDEIVSHDMDDDRYDPPIDSRVEKNDSFALFTNTNGRKKKKKTTVFEPKPKAKPEPEPELETELFLDDEGSVGKLLDEEASEKDEIVSHDMDDDEEEDDDDEDDEQVDLSRMKLPKPKAKAKAKAKLEPEPEPELETELFLDDEGSVGRLLDDEASEKDEIVSHDMDDDEEEDDDDEDDEQVDLSRMKLPELRALAKSRGMKGFTKLKKRELVELLAGGGSS